MRIENWAVVTPAIDPFQAPETRPLSLHGNVFGHPRFKDGHPVTTSSIIGKNRRDEVLTISGSVYELGQVHPVYGKRFQGARNRLLSNLQPSRGTHPTDHVFDIELTCDKCRTVQHLRCAIAEILSNIREAGWPICPECGDDMEENVLDNC